MNKIEISLKNERTKENKKIAIEIVDIDINHNIEETFARAEVTALRSTDLNHIENKESYDYILISIDGKIIFKGRLTSIEHIKKSSMLRKINIIAKPDNYLLEQQAEKLLKKILTNKKYKTIYKKYHSKLVFKEESNATEKLYNLSRICGFDIYCDHKSLELKIIDNSAHAKESDKTKLDESMIIAGSLNQKRLAHIASPSKEKNKNMKIKIHATWIQSQDVIIDLSDHIRKCFAQGLIDTITGSSLIDSWWKEGSGSLPTSNLKSSKYWIIESNLNEVAVPNTGALNLYPRLHGKYADKYLIKHSWFDPTLRILCSYRQSRTEILEFELQDLGINNYDAEHNKDIEYFINHQEMIEKALPWQSNIRYNNGDKIIHNGFIYRALKDTNTDNTKAQAINHSDWEKLCSIDSLKMDSASFFLSDNKEAQKALGCILQITKQDLIRKTYNLINQSFSVPMWIALENGIQVGSDLLTNINGENINSTIKELSLVFKGEEQKFYCKIKTTRNLLDNKDLELLNNKLENIETNFSNIVENRKFCDNYIFNNIHGINWNLNKNPYKLLQNIRVINKSSEQIYKINSLQNSGKLKNKSDLLKSLDSISTQIEIDLFDLTFIGTIEHTINLNKLHDQINN